MSSIKISMHADASGLNSNNTWMQTFTESYTVPSGKKFTGKAILWCHTPNAKSTSETADSFVKVSLGAFAVSSTGYGYAGSGGALGAMATPSQVEIPIELNAGESITGSILVSFITGPTGYQTTTRAPRASLILTGIES